MAFFLAKLISFPAFLLLSQIATALSFEVFPQNNYLGSSITYTTPRASPSGLLGQFMHGPMSTRAAVYKFWSNVID
jgi:hypothetical protein